MKNKLARWCRILKATSKEELKREMGGKWMTMEEKEKLYDEVTKLSEEGEFITMFSHYTEEERRKNTYIQEATERGIEQGKIEMIKKLSDKGMNIKELMEISNFDEKTIENIIKK